MYTAENRKPKSILKDAYMDFEETRNSLPIKTHGPNFVELEMNKLEQKIKQLISSCFSQSYISQFPLQ